MDCFTFRVWSSPAEPGACDRQRGFLDVDPAEDRHQLVGGRPVVGGTGSGSLAESVG